MTRPNLVLERGRWVMLYAGATLSAHGSAVSEDGVTWEKASDAPVLTISDVVRAQILDTELLSAGDGDLLVLVENGGERTTSDVWLLEGEAR